MTNEEDRKHCEAALRSLSCDDEKIEQAKQLVQEFRDKWERVRRPSRPAGPGRPRRVDGDADSCGRCSDGEGIDVSPNHAQFDGSDAAQEAAHKRKRGPAPEAGTEGVSASSEALPASLGQRALQALWWANLPARESKRVRSHALTHDSNTRSNTQGTYVTHGADAGSVNVSCSTASTCRLTLPPLRILPAPHEPAPVKHNEGTHLTHQRHLLTLAHAAASEDSLDVRGCCCQSCPPQMSSRLHSSSLPSLIRDCVADEGDEAGGGGGGGRGGVVTVMGRDNFDARGGVVSSVVALEGVAAAAGPSFEGVAAARKPSGHAADLAIGSSPLYLLAELVCATTV